MCFRSSGHYAWIGMLSMLPTAAVLLPPACLQLLKAGKWTFNSFLTAGLLEYLGVYLCGIRVLS